MLRAVLCAVLCVVCCRCCSQTCLVKRPRNQRTYVASMPKVDGGGFFPPFPVSHSPIYSTMRSALYIYPDTCNGVNRTRWQSAVTRQGLPGRHHSLTKAAFVAGTRADTMHPTHLPLLHLATCVTDVLFCSQLRSWGWPAPRERIVPGYLIT